jgi:two-component system CheB/CheR fusion protein
MELHTANVKLEAAHEEIQSTGEELETTNEELQSTVEELQTTNEELQATNEELETMNDELQSTNVELLRLNRELTHRGDDSGRANLFLNSILTSLRAGMAVVDHDLVVRVWNPSAEDLWGVSADEVVGKKFLKLDVGLPVARLSAQLRACITGGEAHGQTFLPATNRRGQTIRCKVTCMTLAQPNETRGVIVLMESEAHEN